MEADTTSRNSDCMRVTEIYCHRNREKHSFDLLGGGLTLVESLMLVFVGTLMFIAKQSACITVKMKNQEGETNLP